MKCSLCEESLEGESYECLACKRIVCKDCSSTHYAVKWCEECWQIEVEDRGDGEYDPT